MMNVLITGGAGFIGSCLVRRFLEATERRVVTLDKLTYAGNLDSLQEVLGHPRHTFIEGDIRNADLLNQLLGDFGIEAIVHLAAESHVDRSIDGPAAFVETNVVGTFVLLEAARGFWKNLAPAVRERCRFLHVSTDEVYGSLGPTGAFSEQTPYRPNSPYSASKASSDHFVRAYHSTYGLPTLITNCSNNYGPRQFPEKLIPLMILNMLEGKPLPVYGDGENVRDWLFVEDHCAALNLVLERGRPGETYNIGGGSERKNIEVVELLCDLVDRLHPGLPHAPCRGLITHVRDRPGHDRRYAVDASKIGAELGWRPQHGLASGLERTVRWYLENKHWTDRVTSGVYRRQRLGLIAEAI